MRSGGDVLCRKGSLGLIVPAYFRWLSKPDLFWKKKSWLHKSVHVDQAPNADTTQCEAHACALQLRDSSR